MILRILSKSLELFEYAQIVFVKRADVFDVQHHHRQAFHAHTKRVAAVFFGVNAAVAKHVGVHHAGAQHFNPATALAYITAFALAEYAFYVHFHAGFREREERRAEADFGLVAE